MLLFPEFIKQLTWITFRLSVFIHGSLLLFSKVCIYDLLSNLWSHSGASHSRLLCPAPSPGQWALRLQEAASWNRRHPAAEADQDLTLPFIHSFVHASIIFLYVGYQVLGLGLCKYILDPSQLLQKKGKMTKLLGGSEIRHVKHPVECLVHSSNAL